MSELALGALLGLGLFVLVSGSTVSRLVSRLSPHIRDVAAPHEPLGNSDGALRVLGVVASLPAAMVRRSARRRSGDSAVSEELPGALDLLGLCVSAGMTIPAAIERVALVGQGVLADECRLITSEIALGVSVAEALHHSDTRVGHVGWTRLIEHLIAARQQGTPLTDIIRSLADDEQKAAGRRLLESASAKETLMMFPLVFVILPVTVIMAVFPGLTALGSIAL